MITNILDQIFAWRFYYYYSFIIYKINNIDIRIAYISKVKKKKKKLCKFNFRGKHFIFKINYKT